MRREQGTAGVAVGIDAYRAGWVAVALDAVGFARAGAAPTLAAIVAEFSSAEAFGVDIPIGLLERGWRGCDLAAAAMLGRRRSSVFVIPPRAALFAESYADALRICRELTGIGLSRQAYGLGARIREADELAGGDGRIFEVHPEVSFGAMAGRPLGHAKGCWAGMQERLELLQREGIRLPRSLGPADLVPPADILDAAAAAWTARRWATGKAVAVAEPELGLGGRAVSIWY